MKSFFENKKGICFLALIFLFNLQNVKPGSAEDKSLIISTASGDVDGVVKALKEGADYIIEMDADFSHNPKYIPDLLKHIQNYDTVLGSRFVPGGKDIDRTFVRQIVTKVAQNYIKFILGLKVKDPTSGYRCFRRKVVESLALDTMISVGPPIVSEVLYQINP